MFLEPGGAPGHFEDSDGRSRLGWGIAFFGDRIIHCCGLLCSFAQNPRLWLPCFNSARPKKSERVPMSSALKKAVERTQDYIRRDLGDARSFSLDSPKSREPRLAALRAAQV